jgi:hypothetical protein
MSEPLNDLDAAVRATYLSSGLRLRNSDLNGIPEPDNILEFKEYELNPSPGKVTCQNIFMLWRFGVGDSTSNIWRICFKKITKEYDSGDVLVLTRTELFYPFGKDTYNFNWTDFGPVANGDPLYFYQLGEQ